jgi:hypothetical protein
MDIIKAIQEAKLTLTGGYAICGMMAIVYFFLYGLVTTYMFIKNLF